jgi:hypothetical protein
MILANIAIGGKTRHVLMQAKERVLLCARSGDRPTVVGERVFDRNLGEQGEPENRTTASFRGGYPVGPLLNFGRPENNRSTRWNRPKSFACSHWCHAIRAWFI